MERLILSAKRWLTVLALLGSVTLAGQDPSLTNFHITKNYLNPAYAGHTQDFSLSLDNRLQWVKISKFKKFNNYNMAANVGCENVKLGFAFYANDNVEGEGLLRSTSAGFQVARYWPFDYSGNGSRRKTNSSVIAAGIQFGLGQKRLDWEKLVFSDQLSNATYHMVRGTSVVSPQNKTTEFRMDLGGGARFLTELGKHKRASLSAGAAFFHVFTNQESFFSDNSDITRPTRYSGHVFYNQPLGPSTLTNWAGSLGGVYNRQAGVNTFTLMSYAAYASSVRLGVGYRGKDKGLPDAIVIQPTYRGEDIFGNNDWLFSLSYEISTLSSVGQQRSSGTIEFGLIISFANSAFCKSGDIHCFYPNREMKKQNLWGY
ncbi:MAG: type IX secretion system membrane protein PorP/SprF [Owenweeksia sp.]|nr:type IX secretion system membrane protein PorP/SprF [Owenweeksia sp.]